LVLIVDQDRLLPIKSIIFDYCRETPIFGSFGGVIPEYYYGGSSSDGHVANNNNNNN